MQRRFAMRDPRNKPASDDNIIVMPDIYTDEPIVQESGIEPIELVANDDDPSYGFNPYDTARLYKKKDS